MNNNERHANVRPCRTDFCAEGPTKSIVSSVLLRLALVASTALLACVGCHGSTGKPNVVFFLIDDLGWSDVGCYGSDYYETPNIDRLAREGMRFTDAYAGSCVCSPSRASIMTGKYPHRLHITHAIPIDGSKRLNQAQKGSTPLLDADYCKNMPLEEVTLAEALKAGGYRTGFLGKWHCCWDARYFPEHQGYDVNIGGNAMGNPGNYFYPYNGRWRMTPDEPLITWNTLPDGKKGEYLTDRLGEEAVKFIQANKDGPFFLSLWHYAVHTPIQAKPVLRKRFEAKPGDLAKGHTNSAYAAMIKSVDDSVGRVRQALDTLGLADNTVIIFTSDNGGFGPVTSNHPLRGNKGNFYEGGIRVPAIVKWPGITRPGAVSHDVILGLDFYPTLLEVAGLPLRPEQHQDSVSLVPVLKQAGRLKREAVYWHFPNYIGGGHPNPARPCSVIRAGSWKLIESLEDNSVELFDLKSDVRETTNLARERPEKVMAFRQMLARHREATKAQMPRVNPDYVAR